EFGVERRPDVERAVGGDGERRGIGDAVGRAAGPADLAGDGRGGGGNAEAAGNRAFERIREGRAGEAVEADAPVFRERGEFRVPADGESGGGGNLLVLGDRRGVGAVGVEIEVHERVGGAAGTAEGEENLGGVR